MAFPAKPDAPLPPQKLSKPMAFRCETCGKGLDKQYICDAKDPFKPDDDTRRCFGCAGVEAIAKRPVPVDWRLIYGLGVVTWPFFAYIVPAVWRLVK